MSVTCKIHNIPMKQIPAGISKKTGKPYSSFFACPLPDCKETMRDPDAQEPKGAMEAMVEHQPAAAFKQDLGIEEPMKREDWDRKEFIKGLAVFSSGERQQGMSPVDAVKASNTFDWMFVAYGDNPHYEAWAKSALERVKKLANKQSDKEIIQDFDDYDTGKDNS